MNSFDIKRTDITIIGAGIIGISCALFLQRLGAKITLIDREGPGEGCSKGNAGYIGVASIPPRALPGIVKQVPAMLLSRKHPLVIRWRQLPWSFPWFIRFAINSKRNKVEKIADIRKSLLKRAYEFYDPLLEEANGNNLIRKSGLLHLYESEQSYLAATYSRDICIRRGIDVQEVSVDELRKAEPHLGRGISRAILLPQVGYTVNPYQLTQTLAEHFISNGGRFIREEARGFNTEADIVTKIITSSGKQRADIIIISAGVWSRSLVARLGYKVPLEAEWGYHIRMPESKVEINLPMLLVDRKIALTPTNNGLQMTTMADFAGINPKPDYDRAKIIFNQAKKIFADLDFSKVSWWRGPRPSMPDSLPVISKCPSLKNVFFAFGHGHLGMALGPITGKLISQLVMSEKTLINLDPLRVDRF